jgi:hypothetical protein
MAIQGMYAGQLYAWQMGGSLSSASWTLAIPAGNAFSQVHLADYYEFDDKSASEIAIVQTTDNQGAKKNYPDPDATNSVRVAWQANMTTMTIVMRAKDVWAYYIYQVFLS